MQTLQTTPGASSSTRVIDLPALPRNAQRLCLISSDWLHWDRIRWTTERAGQSVKVLARLQPDSVEYDVPGEIVWRRPASNAPADYIYQTNDLADIARPRVDAAGRSGVDSGVDGDEEMTLHFNLSELPPPADGMQRNVFLEATILTRDADGTQH